MAALPGLLDPYAFRRAGTLYQISMAIDGVAKWELFECLILTQRRGDAECAEGVCFRCWESWSLGDGCFRGLRRGAMDPLAGRSQSLHRLATFLFAPLFFLSERAFRNCVWSCSCDGRPRRYVDTPIGLFMSEREYSATMSFRDLHSNMPIVLPSISDFTCRSTAVM